MSIREKNELGQKEKQVVCVYVGVQMSTYRNAIAVLAFTQGSTNNWIMVETNSLRERKQSIGLFSSSYDLSHPYS